MNALEIILMAAGLPISALFAWECLMTLRRQDWRRASAIGSDKGRRQP